MVGYTPSVQLAPQDEELFRSFQSNLLSLISHELRTPLMGVLNSISLMEYSLQGEGESPPSPTEEGVLGGRLADAVKMARRNADRLNQALSSLLDLAAIESGSFHVRLREVNFQRLVKSQFEASLGALTSADLQGVLHQANVSDIPLLIDPQKLSKAIDLCFQIFLPRVEPRTSITLTLGLEGPGSLQFNAQLSQTAKMSWKTAWSQSLIGLQSGASSPYSAFGGVLRSQREFLSRPEEGLGSEFLLIHEIMRLHRGEFRAELRGDLAVLTLKLPELSSEEGIETVLSTRSDVATEIGSVALILIRVPKGVTPEELKAQVTQTSFRSTDVAYFLPVRNCLAVVLNDCKREFMEVFMARLAKDYPKESPSKLEYASAHCPSDTMDSAELLKLAEKRLENIG